MWELLRALYTDTPHHHVPGGRGGGAEVPRALLQGNLRVQLPPLPGAGWDAGAGECGGIGDGAGADVVESLNAILKKVYNDHTRPGVGGAGGKQSRKRGHVVLQAWEWCFLEFDLPLRTHGTPHAALLNMANLMATHSPPPLALPHSPPALVPPINGAQQHGGLLAQGPHRHDGGVQRTLCLLCLFALFLWLFNVSGVYFDVLCLTLATASAYISYVNESAVV